MSAIPDRIARTVRTLVEWLVAGRYDDVASFSSNVRLSASALEQAVSAYGRRLVSPPDEVYDNIDVVEVANSKPPRWSVRFDLWAADEGRSDLTLELTLIDSDVGQPLLLAEVDNIHVL